MKTELVLTAVETCMVRIALRKLAEVTPWATDAGPNKRDLRHLADRLDPYVKLRISEGTSK